MSLPPDRPPPGKAFFATLLVPVLCIAVAAAVPSVTHSLNEGIVLWFLTLSVMVICATICAVMIGQRKDVGIGLLSFLGILIFYAGVALAGCAAVAPKL